MHVARRDVRTLVLCIPANLMLYNNPVASFTGAWIETLTDDMQQIVASFTGAWIEIAVAKSPPSRGRGLKLFFQVSLGEL